jgi:hypothetical protein
MPDWDDTDYSTLAVDYANVRRPDPRIGAQLAAALGDARTIVNVGAGTGSYEPADRHAAAVEPAAEMRRVTAGPIVIMTADPAALGDLWLAEYAPEFHATERARYPSLERIEAALGGPLEARPLKIPLDCTDGFADAFYGRPEAMLDPAVRNAQSAWSFIDADAQSRFARRLRADLDSGAWDERFGRLRTQPEFEGSIRILTSR